MFSQLFAVSVLAAAARSVFAAECSRSYTVKEGDICDTISQSQNVSTFQLATVNSGAVNGGCTNLTPGQTICLALKPEEDCTTTYTVAGGDTCADIASKHAVNATILNLNNPQINDDCSNIYPGEVLCTAKTVQVPPTPATGVVVPAPGTITTVFPTKTPAGTPTPVANAVPTPPPAAATPTDDDDDCDDDDTTPAPVDNDDDLPYCDEI